MRDPNDGHCGPSTQFSDNLHAEKYRQPGEDFRECQNRVAGRLSDGDDHYHQLREITISMRFMFAGRIQSAIGSLRRTTAYNCFVSGPIADSYVDGDGSIMQRATEAAATMRLGGGIGYDFSTLRPDGDLIVKLQSHSSGPVRAMEIFDAVGRYTSSSGHRRGAQMGVMRIDHPDILTFVRAKQRGGVLEGFNISVGVTDEFMECLAAKRPFDLRFGGRLYNQVDPVELWDAIMRSTWDWAEPGVLFLDTINRMNNLWYCESITATNPCAEQPLPPFGACLLGSFNLTKYIVDGASRYFDFEAFKRDIPPVVRAMDNVVDEAMYPLPQQEHEAKSKRRMGLGVAGLANAGEALGLPYGSSPFLEFEASVLSCLRDEAYRASALLAKEKGVFPLYDAEKYLAGSFVQTLPEDVLALIRAHGIRNSHLLSIAPTGTISLVMDNVSSSIEPVFSYKQQRGVLYPDGLRQEDIVDYGVTAFGVHGVRSAEVGLDEHLAVLACAQRYMDSAVSKTCNLDSSTSWDDFKSVYVRAWEMGCKGLTTYNADGKRGAILVSRDEPAPTDGAACKYDPKTGERSCE